MEHHRDTERSLGGRRIGQYDLRINPNNENELFLSNGNAAGNLLFREKLPTPQGTCSPRPNQFAAHGCVSEINNAVDYALDLDRRPQSGAMLAWGTMAVLMAGYESSEQQGAFVDLTEFVRGREFSSSEMPDPGQFGAVFQRTTKP